MILARVADSLYWMNRYLERVEHTARLLGLQLEQLPSSPAQDIANGWRRLFGSLGAQPPGTDSYGGPEDEDDFFFADGYALTDYLTFDTTHPASIVSCLTAARENARQVRDAISNGIWSSLNRAYLRLRDTDLVDIWPREPVLLYRDVVEIVQLFDGVCASSMRRDAGWHCMRIGRFIERAQLVGSLLEAHCANIRSVAEEDGDWAGLLRSCNAFEAYSQLRGAQTGREKVLDFLVYDAELSYSLRFAVNRIRTSLEVIDPPVRGRLPVKPYDIVGRLDSVLSHHMVNLTAGGGGWYDLADLAILCREFHDAFEQTYIYYPTVAPAAS